MIDVSALKLNPIFFKFWNKPEAEPTATVETEEIVDSGNGKDNGKEKPKPELKSDENGYKEEQETKLEGAAVEHEPAELFNNVIHSGAEVYQALWGGVEDRKKQRALAKKIRQEIKGGAGVDTVLAKHNLSDNETLRGALGGSHKAAS